MRILQYTVSQNGIKDFTPRQLAKAPSRVGKEFRYIAQALQPNQ
jgi:hypothetical protein